MSSTILRLYRQMYRNMDSIRKCYLLGLDKKKQIIDLPHDMPVIVGRNKETGIDNKYVSRKQLQLLANLESSTVYVEVLGMNPSGVNGFCLLPKKKYVLKHKDRLEVLLNDIAFEVVFEPNPKLNNNATNNEVTEEPVFKKPKLEIEIKGSWEEIDNKKLYIYTANDIVASDKIAAFDLDCTLIITKSGVRFGHTSDDWKFIYPDVPRKLQNLFNKGYKIVIFTNQGGIGAGKVKIKDFREKIEKIVNKLQIPVQVFASTSRGIYRKPVTGMWDALTQQKNNYMEIDLKSSFYCGDAAGREKNWAPQKRKDFSNCDYLFALNIGIPFRTPEEFFLGLKTIVGPLPKFDPRNLTTQPVLIPESSSLNAKKTEVIILVGFPASGKTYFSKNTLVPLGYVHINRDTLNTWQKCVSVLNETLRKNKSAVIDNTNPDKESRKRFIDIANKHNVSCRCFVMNTSIEQSKHNNLFREIIGENHTIISDIIINSYRLKYEEPKLEEGFSEIVKVNLNPTFNNPKYKKLYHMFLLDSKK